MFSHLFNQNILISILFLLKKKKPTKTPNQIINRTQISALRLKKRLKTKIQGIKKNRNVNLESLPKSTV